MNERLPFTPINWGHPAWAGLRPQGMTMKDWNEVKRDANEANIGWYNANKALADQQAPIDDAARRQSEAAARAANQARRAGALPDWQAAQRREEEAKEIAAANAAAAQALHPRGAGQDWSQFKRQALLFGAQPWAHQQQHQWGQQQPNSNGFNQNANQNWLASNVSRYGN